jgi:NAD(P)H-nitrite reductase large subunit
MLDVQAAGIVQKRLQENGLEVIFGQDAAEVIGNGDLKAIKLDSGKAIGCSLVVVGKGVGPNVDLIKDTEIKMNEGILANNLLQTNIANIYVAGDACESFDLTLGKHAVNALWPVAVEQGKICGANMAGDNIVYTGSLGMNSLEFFGLPIISLGIYKVKDGEPCEELKILDEKAGRYKKIILKDGLIIGAIFVNDIKNSGVFLRLIRERINVSSFKDKLLQENFGYPDIIDCVKEKETIYV